MDAKVVSHDGADQRPGDGPDDFNRRISSGRETVGPGSANRDHRANGVDPGEKATRPGLDIRDFIDIFGTSSTSTSRPTAGWNGFPVIRLLDLFERLLIGDALSCPETMSPDLQQHCANAPSVPSVSGCYRIRHRTEG